mgnify:FL=1
MERDCVSFALLIPRIGPHGPGPKGHSFVTALGTKTRTLNINKQNSQRPDGAATKMALRTGFQFF